MDNTIKYASIKEQLDEALEKKKKAEEDYRQLCQKILSENEEKPEGMSDIEWDLIEMSSEKKESVFDNEISVKHVIFDNKKFLDKSLREQFCFVQIRPCGEEYNSKTFLGILLGDLHSPSISYSEKSKTLVVKRGIGNPAIYVPSIKKIIMGYESWWGKIEKPEDLESITNEDIDNIWYVKMIKEMYNNEKRNTR